MKNHDFACRGIMPQEYGAVHDTLVYETGSSRPPKKPSEWTARLAYFHGLRP